MSDDTNPNGALDTDIAVVGMAGRFPGARNIREYWNNLRSGVESVQRFTDEELLAAGVQPVVLRNPNYVKAGAVLPDMEMFDAAFFGFSPREASIMDPQHRHFLECSWEALENAGHMPERFDGSIGVFGGSGHNAYMPYNLLTNPKLVSQVGFFLIRHTGNDKDFLTTRVSYLLNLKGPSVNVQTACSTSLVAIHTACQSLLNGECDMALAGGVTIELPHRHGYLYQEGDILSPDGHCHAFDADSQGTVFGSGVGVVVLRRLADAIADGDHIHAVIKGSAINNDGSSKVGYLAPSVDGQAQAIAEALAIANVPAETISYVETHGTGTPVGDPIEIAALTQAFRQSTDKVGFCGVGSVKSNIGHTDTAAGVASFMKVALSMQHGELAPSLHFKSPNPACEFETSPFYVNAALKPWTPPAGIPRRAGVSSLGVGGTNAHIVLEEAPKRPASGASRAQQLLILSAKTPAALDAASAALAEHLATHEPISLADAAYTLQVGRQAMKHRRILVAADASEAAAALAAKDPKRVATHTADAMRSVAFMFAGGGAQHPNMGADLYRSEPVFRAAVDECLALLAKRVPGVDFKRVLFPPAGEEQAAARQLERPSLALPMLLTTQYAQAKLWMSWGIEPTGMIGHSMGEYTAAHLAGVFSLEDALRLVELRGRLFERLPEGGMLSVPLSEVELRASMGHDLSIAAVNGPKLTVASGPVHAIEALEQLLASREVEASRVHISVAAHSSMLEPILKEFGDFFGAVKMSAPTRPFVSNLTGTWITAAEAADPAYWVRHLRNTVRFADGLRELLKDENCILLEVGPGRTLASLARQHPGRAAAQPVLNSMRHPDEQVSDLTFVLGQLGRLWANGAAIDWDRFRGNERRLRVTLPTYRFEHQRHWIEPGAGGAAAAVPEPTLDKTSDVADWFYQPVWKRKAREIGAFEAGRALVFLDGGGFGARLAERLRAVGDEVFTVRAGKAFARRASEFTLNPQESADYGRLIETLNAEGKAPQQIYHLWTVDPRLDSNPLKAAHELQRVGFFSLFHLAQAIGHEMLADPIRIAVVSDRMQRVAGETGVVAAKATVLGPCKVIPTEFPNIHCRSIDIVLPVEGSRQEKALFDALRAEAASTDDDDVVAYRATERWVQDFESVQLAQSQTPALRSQGVYLITGGLGGVGLALAEHLAGSVKAKLVLVGRTGLPPRDQWPQLLADGDPQGNPTRRIRAVMALEALGAEVLAVAADVTDPSQMQAAVRQARARFGAINGVLHTAGVLDDGVIQLKEEKAALAVLAPKVRGTLVLEQALAGQPLDFMVLFSSISAFSGLAGQVDYAAANAFLDAYAQDRMLRDGTYTVAVNWSQWQDVGMAAALAQQLGLSHDSYDEAAATGLGHPLLEHCLKDARDERVYTTRFDVARHWLLDEHRVRGGEALIPGTGYLELVRAAFAHKRERRTIEMRNIVFLAPFVVRTGEQKDLRIHVREAGRGPGHFSVVSRAAGSADAAWVQNVRGTVQFVDAAAPSSEAPSAIAARCTRTAQVFTGAEKPVHLDFGPRWSNIKRIDFGDGEAIASLELPHAFVGDLEHVELHPALMDMATAGAQALVPGFDEREDFYVPASYGMVRVYGPLTQSLSSHIRLRREDGGGKDLAVYDVTVIDGDGRVVVEIAEFTMIRVRDKALMARSETAPAAAPAKPRATANHVLELGLREGILSYEGAQALEQILGAGAGPQIVVSPQNLGLLMTQLRESSQPSKDAAHVEAHGDWKAPVTATEQLIAQMWGDMLGVERVSASDNFFDLGGHSLLAVQVINRLRKRTGKALPLTALLEAPTVETLAALIEPRPTGDAADGNAVEAVAPKTGTLIPIRPGGAKTPIFFVHDGNGETLLYRTLALQLDPGHPVFGLQPEVRDARFVHTRISDMAAAHIREIRAVQPKGPYLITGLCAGGVISFEMARQLQEAGDTTLYVGIIDAADVQAQERPFRLTLERLQRLRGLVGEGQDPAIKRIGGAIPLLVRKTANFLKYQIGSRLEQVRNVRKVNSLRNQTEASVAEGALPEIAFLKMYEVAHKEHLPAGVFSGGDVVLYRATKGDGSTADVPFKDIYLGDAMGWERRVTRELVVTDIPGGHSSALQEPNVNVLARKMQEDIDIALSKVSSGDGGPKGLERGLVANPKRSREPLSVAARTAL